MRDFFGGRPGSSFCCFCLLDQGILQTKHSMYAESLPKLKKKKIKSIRKSKESIKIDLHSSCWSRVPWYIRTSYAIEIKQYA